MAVAEESQPNGGLRPGWPALWLLPLAALAFYIAFIPHQSYPYAVHIDDWVHMAHAEAILKSGSVGYLDPFFGEETIGLSSNLELGYQVFWGIFQRISGLSWMTILRYFPSVVLVFTMLAVYVLGRRLGFGYEAAFFACLIPTSIGILGPAFLVPVAMGLFFVPLALFIAFNFRTTPAYLTLFLFTCFLVAIHAPSAICLVIILLPYLLFNLKGDFKHALFLFLAALIPFLAPFPWIFRMLLPAARELFTPQPLPFYVDFPRLIKVYGYLPMALCILGTFVLALKGGKERYGLVIGLVLILLMLVTFFTFHYGIAIMYERGLVFMMLLTAIVAGAGLMAVRRLRFPDSLGLSPRLKTLSGYAGWAICLLLVGLTLFYGIPERQKQPYYYMINDAQYQAFVWIRDNVGAPYGKAILDPWEATPFAAITGKYVFTRTHAFPTARDEAALAFLKEGCRDTELLRINGISIVYTEDECLNPDLTMVREHVYLLRR